MKRTASLRAAIAVAAVGLACASANAAEDAAGIYLLGGKTAMAGYVPPPGTYVTEINYYYSGNASGDAAKGIAFRETNINLNIDADVTVDAQAFLTAPIVT